MFALKNQFRLYFNHDEYIQGPESLCRFVSKFDGGAQSQRMFPVHTRPVPSAEATSRTGMVTSSLVPQPFPKHDLASYRREKNTNA